ncbi:hypothetical protein BZA05DRAFT_384314 [Tricharina praecox]|uniref:uncharacterized protein n=1 Tax=Tricharina praecox TaxID=43433 RepID=UPI002220BB62|nr:uncharacterized protein BZA05DRAFT_384314 [Tricharina praecox]KAI5857668.1 hypothetical protein BZA05DRAFT_384314 [Tricharina praecox]
MSMEKRHKLDRARRWCFIVVLVVTILVVSIVGGVVGSRNWKKSVSESASSGTAAEQADGADTGPSLPLGSVLVRPFRGADRLSTCVARSYQWSCALPPDTRVPTTTALNDDVRVPEFRFVIKRRDATSESGPESDWIPVPRSAPNTTDYESVSSVDGVSDAGEDSDFYITLITKTASNTSTTAKREIIREESHMLPFAVANQPLRLFDRGLETEHFGFHVYFDKTVQFANESRLANSRDMGGVAAADSGYRIQWSNTRFKVSIFTKQTAGKTVETGDDLAELDLPVDVWEDRVGGDKFGRTVTAWVLDADGAPERKVGIAEKRGIRTEERGCYCHWSNYRKP